VFSPEAQIVLDTAIVIFVAALVSSTVGFAFAALAGALVHIVAEPLRAVSILVACSLATQSYCVWKLRKTIDWRELRPFVIAGGVTVPLGVYLLTLTPRAVFATGLGAFLSFHGLYLLLRREAPVLRAGWRADAVAGALAGLAGGLAGLAGSFVTLWCGMRGWPKARQRAVYQPFILLMQLEALVCLAVHAPATAMSPETFVVYIPIALTAASVGMALYRRMTTRQFALAANALLLVCGLALLGSAL
jgi:uncharacterized protein